MKLMRRRWTRGKTLPKRPIIMIKGGSRNDPVVRRAVDYIHPPPPKDHSRLAAPGYQRN